MATRLCSVDHAIRHVDNIMRPFCVEFAGCTVIERLSNSQVWRSLLAIVLDLKIAKYCVSICVVDMLVFHPLDQ